MKKLLIVSFLTLLSFQTYAIDDRNNVEALGNRIDKCRDTFLKNEKECPESWSMRCYNHLITVNQQAQNCYTDTAKNIFHTYYSEHEKEALEKLKEFQNLIYNHYLFIYENTDYCTKNNCGVSPHLYSEYATTIAMQDYLITALKSIEARQ